MRPTVIVAVVAALTAAFIALNSVGHVTITLGVARLILPTQLEVFAAFVLGLLTMAPLALKGSSPGVKLITDQTKTKAQQLEHDKQVEAEVARLKADKAAKPDS